MMTGRAWFLGSELAGVVTAMITYKGRARALTRQSPMRHLVPRHPKDFADSLVTTVTHGELVVQVRQQARADRTNSQADSPGLQFGLQFTTVQCFSGRTGQRRWSSLNRSERP